MYEHGSIILTGTTTTRLQTFHLRCRAQFNDMLISLKHGTLFTYQRVVPYNIVILGCFRDYGNKRRNRKL